MPSFVACVTPWVWADRTVAVAWLAAHVVWLFVAERLAPRRERPRPAPSRPVTLATPAPSRPAFAVLTVLATIDETPDIRTLRFARPPDFVFKPGQFVPVRVTIDGRPHVRCYSISSAPHVPGYFEISVRRQGLVSGTLHATVRTGSMLAVGAPAGAFVYPQGDERPLALIAGGIGITPLLSMVRHAAVVEPQRPVVLLYSARTDRDVLFRRELQVLVERHPNVRIALTLSRPSGDTRIRSGRVDANFIGQHVAAPAHTLFYLCGPGPMIDGTRQILGQLGAPAANVRAEAFELAVAATSLLPSLERDGGTSAARQVTVTFSASRQSVSTSVSETLLDAAEAGGVLVPSSCRSGVCQTCRTRLTSGRADCRSDLLDPADRAAGYILPCVTWPEGDCEVDA